MRLMCGGGGDDELEIEIDYVEGGKDSRFRHMLSAYVAGQVQVPRCR